MPLNGSAGFSDNTPLKQEHFSAVLGALFPAMRSIIRRHDWAAPRALYVDLNAGPGYYPEVDLLGSPALALRAARAAQLALEAVCFEQDEVTCKGLVEWLQQAGGMQLHEANEWHTLLCEPGVDRWMTCIARSYERALPSVLVSLARSLREQKQTALGVIYSDENGSPPPILYLQLAASKLPRCDVVLQVAAANVKRVLHSPMTAWEYSLENCLALIDRKYWIVREPFGKHQWSFLIGSHWDQFPVLTAQGFHRVHSPRGSEIFRLLNERKEDLL